MNDTKKSLRSKKKTTVSKIRRAIVIVAIFLIEFTVFIVSVDLKVEANPQKEELEVEFSFTEKSAEQLRVTEKLTIEDETIETSVNVEPEIKIEDIIENIGPEMEIGQTSGISLMNFKYAMKNCKYDVNGILAENAQIIWIECQRKNLNEFAVVGIIAAESWWANPEKSELAANKKNIMSIKNDRGEYKEYSKYSDCIRDGIRLISEEYVSQKGNYATGGNLKVIGDTYAPGDELWPNLVAECAEMSTRALTTSND